MPFAPSAATVPMFEPVRLQLDGMPANSGGGDQLHRQRWRGFSGDFDVCAIAPNPRDTPLTNWAHSPTGLPPGPVTAGSARAGSSTPGAMMRRP